MRPPPPNRSLLAIAVTLLLPVLAGACNLVFGIEPGKPDATGGGGSAGAGADAGAAGSAGAAGGMAGGGTGAVAGGGAGGATGGAGGTGGGGMGGALTDGLALLLHMDEADWSAADAVVDSSGQGNHGTVMGTAVPVADGKNGGAGQFDGGGWILVPDSASLHATTGLTCAVWVYPTGLTDGMAGFPAPGIVSKREALDVNVAFTLFLWENNRAFVDIEADRFYSDGAFSNGQWYHLAFVYDGTAPSPLRTRIYINGVLDSVHASTPALAANVQDIHIGDLPGGGETFLGKLDDVALWTRALTEAEIQSVYQGGLPP